MQKHMSQLSILKMNVENDDEGTCTQIAVNDASTAKIFFCTEHGVTYIAQRTQDKSGSSKRINVKASHFCSFKKIDIPCRVSTFYSVHILYDTKKNI